jgi:hypothetical protein
MRSICLRIVVVAVLAFHEAFIGNVRAGEFDELATRAVSEDASVSEPAIAQLRTHGPAGLDALFAVHAAAIQQMLIEPDAATTKAAPALQRVRQALDHVGGQRDCHACRLFWYTDLAQAKAVAKMAGKPILSLRLLGKLTDEYSCANSRFFRSTLYPNDQIGRVLREQFILHWQTVRPVPLVTIDFGDGRKLIRTVTGNSVHYVLTPDGQPLDALPGLYGPQPFLKWLEQADELAHAVMTDGNDKAALIAKYHARENQALLESWQRDLSKVGAASDGVPISSLPSQEISDAVWHRIAILHERDCQLDAASQNLIACRNPVANVAGRIAATKTVVESPLVRLLRDLQGTIAIDTVRNEYLLHRQIHEWFAAGQVRKLNAFNQRVYAELFLTPSTDPWLGLLPDAYSALENNGVVMSGDAQAHPGD